jgi:F-type H+/Na+-transporting ATPase subunit alpha
VEKFLGDLTDSVRGNEPDLLKKIAGGDWSDETQEAVDKAVKQFAEDFGYDLDEEGHPLEEDDDEPRRRSDERSEGETADQDKDGEGSETETEQEEAGAPA